jgi:formylglycine-generating enzyme required for sulfatase activity/tRNA A-37 threonylcarbamoyl transferase component Bud32
MQQWSSGYRLKNRPYEIERELGEGGFGITYKAKHLTLDIPVVIKTPNSKLQKDINYPKYVENFKREGKQLAQLGLNPHPHIVRVSDLFDEENLPCIIMDFVPGESLYDLVMTQGSLSQEKALGYIKQIGSALIVCHKAGIIHRDVHPNNILIHAENGKAILIDFGIAGTTQTSRNTHSGNRAFAPWEQLASWEQQNSKTPQVDIYTLAASLYYLVTGKLPTECLARKYNHSELIEPKQLNSSLSKTVNKAILKGMEVLPANRPISMQEWLDLLVNVPKKQENRKQSINKREIPLTFVLEKEQPVQSLVVREPSQKNISTPRRNRNKITIPTITRRRWLEYASLTLGATGIALVGKGLWNDFGKKFWNNLSQQTKKLNSSQKSNSATNSTLKLPKEVKNQPTLTEYKFDVITVNDRGEEIKREQGKAKYFTEDLGNGILIEMLAISGGTLMMGALESEKGSNDDEYPQHQVKVKDFYLKKFPVTQAQWQAVAKLPRRQQELELYPSKFRGDKLPVERISWDDAIEFCARLSKATGKEYRLPSEAEWEYACRAGTTTAFHYGKTITGNLANYDARYTYTDEAQGEYRNSTTPVGSFPPNAFGLHDMHGNVWEWCADTWHDSYQGAPNDGSAWISNADNSNQYVLRGGSWYVNPSFCRSASRDISSSDLRDLDIGFRVVCVVSKTT